MEKDTQSHAKDREVVSKLQHNPFKQSKRQKKEKMKQKAKESKRLSLHICNSTL